MKFCWTTVAVRNMDESLNFYRDVVGLELDRKFKSGPNLEIAFLGKGETKVELICDSKNANVSFGQDISLGFEVPSLDAVMAKIKQKGIAIHSGPFQPNPHIKFSYVLDPNGLKIQFVENM